jgi:biotin carboxyl carrier protein
MLYAALNGKNLEFRQEDGAWQSSGSNAVPEILSADSGKICFLLNNQRFEAEIVEINKVERFVALRINGKPAHIALSTPLDKLLHDMGMDTAAATKATQVKAPMPGLVLRILVEAGAEVQKDDKVMILEAMKMENVIKSPGHGIVKQILVQAGQAVDKNQVLIDFQ